MMRISILVLNFVILSMQQQQSQECQELPNQDHPTGHPTNEGGKIMAGKVSGEWSDSVREPGFEEGLKAKLQRLRAFMGQLGELRDSGINPESLEQLEIEQEVYRNVGWEVVVAEAEKRIEKMAKTRKLKRNWSICDLKILIWLICKHCEQTNIPVAEVHNHDDSWLLISSLIPGTSPDSCLFKWLSLRRHKITLHGWSEHEEQILLSLEKKHAESRNKWKYISEELYALNPNPDKIYRHPKQCREHYASFLDPCIKKGPWTKEEDLTLLSHIIENGGQKKWCRLVKILEGRTENAIKNRFQLVFAKLRKRKENKSKPELELITDYVRENGGVIPVKKQRESAAKSEPPAADSTPNSNPIANPNTNNSPASPIKVQPPLSPHSPASQENLPAGPKLPVIPTFNFFPSSRSLSAFVPYLQQGQYQQLPYRQLGRRGSLESLPLERQS